VKFHIPFFLIQHYMEWTVKLHAAGAMSLVTEKIPSDSVDEKPKET
jgi:hypothetical protein